MQFRLRGNERANITQISGMAQMTQISLISSASNRGIAYKKVDFNLILSGGVFLLVLLACLLNNYFIIDLKSTVEKETVAMILSNQTIINENKNSTSLESCRKLITEVSLIKFKTNLDNYEKNKSCTIFISAADSIVSFLLFIALLILIKYDPTVPQENFLKKLSIGLAFLFTILEFISLIIYLSIYMKTYHMYKFIEKTIRLKCFNVYMFKDINETIVYAKFINSFIPSVRFVYSCAVILIVIHFINLIILLYKIKLLIIINMSNRSLNDSFTWIDGGSDNEPANAVDYETEGGKKHTTHKADFLRTNNQLIPLNKIK